jgi:hypothetical protein
MDAIQLGPLLIKKIYVILLFSCLMAYLYIVIILKNKPDTLKVVENHLTSSLLLWIFVFKFSIILFRPSILWTNPYGLLFFTGGTRGAYLAAFLSVFYIFRKFHQSNIHIKTSAVIVIPSIFIILLTYFGLTTLL